MVRSGFRTKWRSTGKVQLRLQTCHPQGDRVLHRRNALKGQSLPRDGPWVHGLPAIGRRFPDPRPGGLTGYSEGSISPAFGHLMPRLSPSEGRTLRVQNKHLCS
jgi:hypothetical protein